MIHQDSQTYTPRSRGLPPPIAISGDTPQITIEDLQSEERMLHEELLSELWALVYLLRSQLITASRLARFPLPEGTSEALAAAGRDAAATKDLLSQRIEDYVERWGEQITHGDAVFDTRRLARLAGWNDSSRKGRTTKDR